MSEPLMPEPIDVPSVRFRKFHFRLWQIIVTLVTLFLTFFFFTLGTLPGIAFLFLSKHILVAVFAAGLHYPPRSKPVAKGFNDGVIE